VINRHADRAIFKQLADLLRAEIMASSYVSGDRLPSVDALCRTYGVGREVATKALKLLENEGLIDTPAGRPAVVREVPVRTPLVLEPGTRWSARMPTWDERTADPNDHIPEGTPVVEVWLPGGEVRLLRADRYEFLTAPLG